MVPCEHLALLCMTVLITVTSHPLLGMLAPSPTVNSAWSSQGVHVGEGGGVLVGEGRGDGGRLCLCMRVEKE